MCDEAGTNFLGIEAALGKILLAKTVSCQWYFCQCTKNHMKQVNEHDKETFKSLFSELCYTLTTHHFEKVSLNKVIFQNGGVGGMLGAIILFQHFEGLICLGLIWLNLGTHLSNVDKRCPFLL